MYVLQGEADMCLCVRRDGGALSLSVMSKDGDRSREVKLGNRSQHQHLLRFIIAAMNKKDGDLS